MSQAPENTRTTVLQDVNLQRLKRMLLDAVDEQRRINEYLEDIKPLMTLNKIIWDGLLFAQANPENPEVAQNTINAMNEFVALAKRISEKELSVTVKKLHDYISADMILLLDAPSALNKMTEFTRLHEAHTLAYQAVREEYKKLEEICPMSILSEINT